MNHIRNRQSNHYRSVLKNLTKTICASPTGDDNDRRKAMIYATHQHRLKIGFSKSQIILRLLLLLSLNGPALASQTCVATLDELHTILGDRAFPLKWEETTMNDGEPLLVSIHENQGALFLEFVKKKKDFGQKAAALFAKTQRTWSSSFRQHRFV